MRDAESRGLRAVNKSTPQPAILLLAVLSWLPSLLPATTARADERIVLLDGAEATIAIATIDDSGELRPIPPDPVPRFLDDLLELRPLEFNLLAVAEAPHPAVLVQLHDGTSIQAAAIRLADERATVDWPHSPTPLSLAIDDLARVTWGSTGPLLSSSDIRWRASAETDRVILRDGAGFQVVPGLVSAITADSLTIDAEGQSRELPRDRVSAVVFAQPAGVIGPPATRHLELSDGSSLESNKVTYRDSTWAVHLGASTSVRLPRDAVRRVLVRSPRLRWLSTLAPATVEQAPLAAWPRVWQRDRAVTGGPLTLGTRRYSRGIGTQAPTRLTYRLDGRFESFIAEVGLDAAVRGRGDCQVSVWGDAPQPLVSFRLHGSDPARTVRVSVAGLRQLALAVEPGEHLDLADHVDWADARLIQARPSPP